MKVIDFHAHIYPTAISAKATQSVGDFYSIPMFGDGTADMLLADGAAAGISAHVVHSVAVLPRHVQNINNFIAAECAAYPDRFFGFGTVHADMENPKEEIERIISLGLHGIKIHPDTQHFNLDCDGMMKIYELIEGRLPVLIHCGDYRYDYSHPRRTARVIDAFPGLTVIAAHFGGWSLYDLAVEYLEDRFCYMDVSSSMMYTGNRRARELIRLYGAERMLFGADYPMWSPKEELERFMSLGLTDAENELILHKNAEKILGI